MSKTRSACLVADGDVVRDTDTQTETAHTPWDPWTHAAAQGVDGVVVVDCWGGRWWHGVGCGGLV